MAAASLFLPLWLGLFGGLGIPQGTVTPEQIQTRFEMASGYLDAGGDLFMVKSIAGQMQGMVKMMRTLAESGRGNDSEDAVKLFADLDTFLQESGLFSMHTVAGSTVPRPDGLKNLKLFIGRDADAADKPLWTGLTGGPAGPMQFLSVQPDSCVLGLETAAKPEDIWGMVRRGMLLFGCKGDADKLADQLQKAEKELGVSPDALFASLTGGLAVTIHMDSARTISLPLGQNPLSIPEPGFVAVANVKDDTLLQFMLHGFEEKGMQLSEKKLGTVTIHQVDQPLPAPFPLQPAFSIHNGHFYLASTPALLEKTIRPSLPDRLGKKAAFTAMFSGQNATGNAFFYCDARLRETLKDVFNELQKSSGGNPQLNGITALFDPGSLPAMSSYWVLKNTPDGVLLAGTGNGNGIRQIVSGNPGTPAILAGMLLPALNNARSRARAVGCRNNLRQIYMAKEQWMLDHNGEDGKVLTRDDLKPYVGNSDVFTCPKGGHYEINPIGQKPTCTYPGHRF